MVNIKRPKHLFTERNLHRLLQTAWTQDDLIFVAERCRIQFTFTFLEFCWTGARLGAFFDGGLRYKVCFFLELAYGQDG